jgi:uncharacterized protein (TIGR02646 family)
MRYFQREPLYEAIQKQLLAKISTNWNNLSDIQRREILAKLLASQKKLCAYCECRITKQEGNHHIEHFEEQHDAPTRVFDYTNLLLSCEGNRDPASRPEAAADAQYRTSNTSCGHRKTKGHHGEMEIDYALLLNPTNNVAALFAYMDGIVEPSNVCTPKEKIQVEYTINRLNLAAHRIENNRINELNLILNELEGLTESEQKTYIGRLLDENQAILNPYFSTISDNFGFMLL